MDLIQSEQENVPVEAEPRYVSKTASLPAEKTEHGQAWLRILVISLATIVIIVLIVLFSRWVYQKINQKDQPAPAATQQTPAESSRNAQEDSQPAGNAGGGSGPSTTPQANPNTPGANSPPIANTGPGDVVAIFVGTTLAAGGLHYLISMRKNHKPNVQY